MDSWLTFWYTFARSGHSAHSILLSTTNQTIEPSRRNVLFATATATAPAATVDINDGSIVYVIWHTDENSRFCLVNVRPVEHGSEIQEVQEGKKEEVKEIRKGEKAQETQRRAKRTKRQNKNLVRKI